MQQCHRRQTFFNLNGLCKRPPGVCGLEVDIGGVSFPRPRRGMNNPPRLQATCAKFDEVGNILTHLWHTHTHICLVLLQGCRPKVLWSLRKTLCTQNDRQTTTIACQQPWNDDFCRILQRPRNATTVTWQERSSTSATWIAWDLASLHGCCRFKCL